MIQFDIYRDATKEIYADDIPEFCASEYWGNLSNKVHFVFSRLDYLNDILVSICEKVELYKTNLKQRNGLNNKKTVITPYIEIIHVMSDLRMIIDELIALLYIVEKRKDLGDYPTKIELESIGKLLGKWNENKFEEVSFFLDYKTLLKNVNDITNTYKHSFINDHVLFYRQLEKPTVYAIRNFNSEFDKQKNKLLTVPLENIINDFNIMFKNYISLLKEMTNEQIVIDYENKKKNSNK
ncbi:hypothetical protein [Flavobacterium sp.]|uniref:hypothetical protein n=1 Tax=Flavobacterium sp. TaxID=239 RepID=UPI0031D1BA8F